MYAHLKKINVKEGSKIKKGNIIALSGNTGYSTAPHLHYSIFKNDNLINPIKLVNMPHTKEVEEEYKLRGEVFID